MLLCDHCQRECHMACLIPPLLTLPSGNWICPRCRKVSHSMAVNGHDWGLCGCLPHVLVVKLLPIWSEVLWDWKSHWESYQRIQHKLLKAIKDGAHIAPSLQFLDYFLNHEFNSLAYHYPIWICTDVATTSSCSTSLPMSVFVPSRLEGLLIC